MTDRWTVNTHPSRIVFGPGTIEEVAEEVERLGRSRGLVLVEGP